MHRRAHELTSGLIAMPLLIAAGSALMAFLAQETQQPKGTIEYDLVRLVLTVVSSGGVVYLVVQKAVGVWERNNEISQKEKTAALEALQVEIQTLRERDGELREKAAEQCRADIAYYRDLYQAERTRVDSCQAQLKRGSSGSG